MEEVYEELSNTRMTLLTEHSKTENEINQRPWNDKMRISSLIAQLEAALEHPEESLQIKGPHKAGKRGGIN